MIVPMFDTIRGLAMVHNQAKWMKRLASCVLRFESLKQHKILLYLALTIIALGLAIWYFHGPEELFGELMGNVFVGVIIAELVLLLLRSIGAAVVDYSEDALKLTSDYKGLMNDYERGLRLSDVYKTLPPLYSYSLNLNLMDSRLFKTVRKESDYWNGETDKEGKPSQIRFPVIVESKPQDGMLLGEVEDHPDEKYHLPTYLQVHFAEIMAAHSASSLFNNIVIRVDDFHAKEGRIHLQTSRSTYFASMVTNRAVDFRFNDGPTVRRIFDYDLHTPPLRDSRLSNHLGFNIVVTTSDGYMVFVERSKNMSIGKRSYGTGVGASLKTRYAILADEDRVTLKGIENAVIYETIDELNLRKKGDPSLEDKANICPEDFFDLSMDDNYLAFYRDLVEGGKPQLLFWLDLKMSFSELQQNAWRTKSDGDKALLSDGNRYVGITLDDLQRAIILPDGIAANVAFFKDRKRFSGEEPKVECKLAFLPMVPSASASVAIYRDSPHYRNKVSQ